MQYRIHPKTKDKISVIGLGSAYIYENGIEEGAKAYRYAFENGINYFDLAAGHRDAFLMAGKALHDVRDQVFYQIHFGADYHAGEYGWSLDLDTIKESVQQMLEDLQTDYIDYGFIHCQDELSDWETYKKNGVYAYLLELKEKGIVRHIGLSSHTPKVIMKILEEIEIDTLMFSINPAYDYGEGEYAFGEVEERNAIYQRCEKEKIAITVMKPFSGGQLVDASLSPFKEALSIYQCIKYALDKPGVLCVLPGAKTKEEVKALLEYETQSQEALDYSIISTFAPPEANGKCVYCGHCKPCPMGIEIDLVNKYYDLALVGDVMAIEHYQSLDKNASDCISCGHCDSRCPFHVEQSKRMNEIKDYMENL